MDSLSSTNDILQWTAQWSGSDYIGEMARPFYGSIPLKERHGIVLQAIICLEEHECGPLSRLVGNLDPRSGLWTYKIGWGGTVVEIHPETQRAWVRSMYWKDGEAHEKGRVLIADKALHWESIDDGEHSWGRLKDLHIEFLRWGYSSNPPQKILNYVHDIDVGGGY